LSNKINIVLFVNDSYFSYLLSKKIIELHHKRIKKIIFSRSTKSSAKKIFKIFNKVPITYFFYRSFIQALTSFFFKRKTVSYLAQKFSINTLEIDKGSDLDLVELDKFNLGFCFNFDLILHAENIDCISKGIYNIHASKLPLDKGISPVLWAFSRGDKKIWSSIYKIDEGIDSGALADQFSIDVKDTDSAFSLYKRVCIDSGARLVELIRKILSDSQKLTKIDNNKESSYNSWPDNSYKTSMKNNNKKHFKIINIFEI